MGLLFVYWNVVVVFWGLGGVCCVCSFLLVTIGCISCRFVIWVDIGVVALLLVVCWLLLACITVLTCLRWALV